MYIGNMYICVFIDLLRAINMDSLSTSDRVFAPKLRLTIITNRYFYLNTNLILIIHHVSFLTVIRWILLTKNFFHHI